MQTRIDEEASFGIPFRKIAVIEQFHLIGYDEGDDIAAQAFLQHDEPSDASVAVLEGMDASELHVEIRDLLKRMRGLRVVGIKKSSYFVRSVFRYCRFPIGNFVQDSLVVSDGKSSVVPDLRIRCMLLSMDSERGCRARSMQRKENFDAMPCSIWENAT